MSEVKVKSHMNGRDRPTTGKGGHPTQAPGAAAGGVKMGCMGWNGPSHKEHHSKYVK